MGWSSKWELHSKPPCLSIVVSRPKSPLPPGDFKSKKISSMQKHGGKNHPSENSSKPTELTGKPHGFLMVFTQEWWGFYSASDVSLLEGNNLRGEGAGAVLNPGENPAIFLGQMDLLLISLAVDGSEILHLDVVNIPWFTEFYPSHQQ